MRSLRITQSVTNRESESVERYLREIKKYPVLSPDEELELVYQIKQGNRCALEKLTKSNLKFVVAVAKKYQHHGLSLADLISEGNIGLLKATEKFDESRGFKFISYAIWRIRQSILQALSEHARIIRLPTNKINSLKEITAAMAKLEQEYQRAPDLSEVAETLGIDLEEARNTFSLVKNELSLDTPNVQDADESPSLSETIACKKFAQPDKEANHSMNESRYDQLFSGLISEDAEIIKLYFGLDGREALNMREIGKLLKKSAERISQRKDRGLKVLEEQFKKYPHLQEVLKYRSGFIPSLS